MNVSAEIQIAIAFDRPDIALAGIISVDSDVREALITVLVFGISFIDFDRTPPVPGNIDRRAVGIDEPVDIPADRDLAVRVDLPANISADRNAVRRGDVAANVARDRDRAAGRDAGLSLHPSAGKFALAKQPPIQGHRGRDARRRANHPAKQRANRNFKKENNIRTGKDRNSS